MNILLIAGHGNGDPGACATFNGTTYRESDLARYVVNALKTRLAPFMGVTVYDTARCAYDDYINGTLRNRANFSKQDYVLEIHFNACSRDTGDGSTKGVEAYVPTAETSYGVETAICKNVAACGLRNRGVKKKNWSVIYTAKKAGVSACLLEVCFIDDADDMKIYGAKFSEIMDGIAKGIVEGFGVGTYKAETEVVTKSAESAQAATKPSTAVKKTSSARSFSADYKHTYRVKANGGLNMRYGAGTSNGIIKTLTDGSKFICYGYYTKTKDGTIWLLGVDSSGVVGFCSKSYLI